MLVLLSPDQQRSFLRLTHPELIVILLHSSPVGLKGGCRELLRVQISVDYRFSTVKALSVHRNMWINLPCVPGNTLTLLTKLTVSVMMLNIASVAC